MQKSHILVGPLSFPVAMRLLSLLDFVGQRLRREHRTKIHQQEVDVAPSREHSEERTASNVDCIRPSSKAFGGVDVRFAEA